MVTHDAFDQILPPPQWHRAHNSNVWTMKKRAKTYLYTFLDVAKRKKLFNINDGNGSSLSLPFYFLNVYVFMHSYIAIRLYSPCPFRYSHIAQMNATFLELFSLHFRPFSCILSSSLYPFGPFSSTFTFTLASMSNDAFDVITE